MLQNTYFIRLVLDLLLVKLLIYLFLDSVSCQSSALGETLRCTYPKYETHFRDLGLYFKRLTVGIFSRTRKLRVGSCSTWKGFPESQIDFQEPPQTHVICFEVLLVEESSSLDELLQLHIRTSIPHLTWDVEFSSSYVAPDMFNSISTYFNGVVPHTADKLMPNIPVRHGVA